VRYLQCHDDVSEIRATWRTLEDFFPSLSGQKFLGVFDPAAGWYRACVVETPDAKRAISDLPRTVVPGGGYARLRLQGEAEALYSLLPAAFATLEASCVVDAGRPRIEVYRRHTEVDVLVPVTDANHDASD
jgi:DNA gyrase inhibitor GyrI